MRTFYFVNGKKVGLEEYTKSEYDNIFYETHKITFEKWLKKNPQILKDAKNWKKMGFDGESFIYSSWQASDDYKTLQSSYNPQKYAKQKAGCMLLFYIAMTIGCIIAFVNL